MSDVHENSKRAERRDAVRNQKFHFRFVSCLLPVSEFVFLIRLNGEIAEYNMDTIINGSKDPLFPGLLHFAKKYVHEAEKSEDIRNSYKVRR